MKTANEYIRESRLSMLSNSNASLEKAESNKEYTSYNVLQNGVKIGMVTSYTVPTLYDGDKTEWASGSVMKNDPYYSSGYKTKEEALKGFLKQAGSSFYKKMQ